MNVKTGDLAMVTQSLNGSSVGKLVTVGRLAFPSTVHGPVWEVQHPHPILTLNVGRKDGKVKSVGSLRTHTHCPDAWLKRIDDPSDGESDESRAWLPPVPTTTKETA